jgi:multidrug efflux pump subunit AcrB
VFFIIAGLAAMRALPIAQYPEIAPPVVTVQAVYPGASQRRSSRPSRRRWRTPSTACPACST